MSGRIIASPSVDIDLVHRLGSLTTKQCFLTKIRERYIVHSENGNTLVIKCNFLSDIMIEKWVSKL